MLLLGFVFMGDLSGLCGSAISVFFGQHTAGLGVKRGGSSSKSLGFATKKSPQLPLHAHGSAQHIALSLPSGSGNEGPCSHPYPLGLGLSMK